jgi:hypothetical protein
MMRRKKYIRYKMILCLLLNMFGQNLLKVNIMQRIADKFNKLANGEIKRLIINMPPRHTKSEFASFLTTSMDDWSKT